MMASGSIQTGGSKPTLEIGLSISDAKATENPQKSASFDIFFSENELPENLTVPISLNGTAKFGQDFQLCIPVWNDQTNEYDQTIISHNIIPVKLKKGDQKLSVKTTGMCRKKRYVSHICGIISGQSAYWFKRCIVYP